MLFIRKSCGDVDIQVKSESEMNKTNFSYTVYTISDLFFN